MYYLFCDKFRKLGKNVHVSNGFHLTICYLTSNEIEFNEETVTRSSVDHSQSRFVITRKVWPDDFKRK